MPMIDYALQYAARGWYVFALAPRSKLPLISKKNGGRGFLDATRDPAQLEAWWAKTPLANIGIATGASGLIVLDADGPQGLAQLQELAQRLGGGPLPRTLVQRTGRDGGLHFIYRGTGIKSSQVKGEHLDVRGSSGYIVAPPSVHPSGATYQWVDATVPIADVPAWVKGWVNTRKGGAPQAAAPMPAPAGNAPARVGRGLAARSVANLTESPKFSEAEADRLFSALSVIDAATDGATWFSYGAALHDLKWIVNGTDEGFEIWDEWSSSSKGRGDGLGEYKGRADLEKRWASFDREYNGPRCTVASIFAAAKAAGWAYEAKPEYINGHASLPEFAPQFTQSTAGNPLIELNQKYSVIGDIGGKCMVMSWVQSKLDSRLEVPSFQSWKSFTERYSNRYIQIENEPRQIGAYWLKWPLRKTYESIDLVPGAPQILPNGALNLWRGFGVEPVPGVGPDGAPQWGAGWRRMQAHIHEILAAGDAATAAYIAKFAAWSVQNPDDRAEVALVFRGGKGSGKGTFANALVRMFGSHGLQIYNSKHLVGAFNGHLRNCILLFADEAFWAGDRQGESVLKGMLTERALVIEQKGIDAVAWKNRLHVIMAANADWVVPASHDERRYVVFDVAPKRIGDPDYFRALHSELDGDGLSHMLHDLLKLPLAGWHPRQIIQTPGLQKQKAMSLGAVAAWWENILQNGTVPAAFENISCARASDLLDDLVAYSGHVRDANGTALGRFLIGAGCERLHRREGNFWQFPTLLNARLAWERKMGGWPWQAKIDDWRQISTKRS